MANTFWLLRRDGMSVQQAVDHLAGLLRGKQDEFIARRANILGSPLGGRADVRAYLDALSNALGGNLQYHRTSRRYHGPAHDGTLVNRGTVTISERSNTFVPDQRPPIPAR